MAATAVGDVTRVRLNSARVGHIFNDKGAFAGEFAQAAGDIVEMPTAEAQRYLKRGLASAVSEKSKN